MTNSLRSSLSRCRRPVIKLGSTVLAGAAGKAGPPSLDRRKFALLCDDLAAVAGKRGPLLDLIQVRYGYDKARAEKELDALC